MMENKRDSKSVYTPIYIKNFEIYLPTIRTSAMKGEQKHNRECVQTDVVTPEQILGWSEKGRGNLRIELESILNSAFPMMSEEEYKYITECYFRLPGRELYRQALLFRNEAGQLIATALCDQGEIVYEGKTFKVIYNILRAVLPEYQENGLGQTAAIKVLTELQPDILLVTTYQSSSLHSWVDLPQKSLIKGFEIYPRLEKKHEKDVLITLPYKDLELAIYAFKHTFIGFVQKEQELEKEIRNLTVHLVRKDTHGKVYDFHPWKKGGRKDTLAQALGVTDKDGIIVMFKKKRVIYGSTNSSRTM